jgi:hypothetical protein
MWQRPVCAALLAIALSACRQVKPGDPTLITGGGPVAVLQSSYVSSGDSQAALGAGPVTYVVARIELTNESAAPLYPMISRFSLMDQSGNRFFGIDTGAAVLAGISNDLSPIRPGEKRTVIVAFRAGSTTIGTIRYDY